MKNKSRFSMMMGILMLSTVACQKEEITNKKLTMDEIDLKNPKIKKNGLKDIDGNKYKTVIIGEQEWMAENLNVSTYRNGDIIPQVTDADNWAILTTGAWCYYNNDPASEAIYGKLYNWYAVNDPRGLAPQGWHVPTDAEFIQLSDGLGGGTIAGGKLKATGTVEAGTGLWREPNIGADNSSGFTGLGGGNRLPFTNSFFYQELYGYWWSATEATIEEAWYRALGYNIAEFARSWQRKKSTGHSVRCLKD